MGSVHDDNLWYGQLAREREERVRDAAPELLAALKALLDAHWPLVETEDHEDPACATARAVIAKAEPPR